MAITNFDPKLSQYRVTQLVDLCKAREAGNRAAPQGKTVESQEMCSTFQSLIHGHADTQASANDIPQLGRGLWRPLK